MEDDQVENIPLGCLHIDGSRSESRKTLKISMDQKFGWDQRMVELLHGENLSNWSGQWLSLGDRARRGCLILKFTGGSIFYNNKMQGVTKEEAQWLRGRWKCTVGRVWNRSSTHMLELGGNGNQWRQENGWARIKSFQGTRHITSLIPWEKEEWGYSHMACTSKREAGLLGFCFDLTLLKRAESEIKEHQQGNKTDLDSTFVMLTE